MTALLVFAPFIVLVATAACWDLATYTIPNTISALLLIAFAVFVALAAGFALFSLGYIGGGDAKLFAAVAAWFGFHDLLEYTLLASVFGGALTLALLAIRKYPLPASLATTAWVARLHEPRGGIPYGVALAAGAIAVLPYTDVFHRALG
jgi:prepilin peptidase CpaA